MSSYLRTSATVIKSGLGKQKSVHVHGATATGDGGSMMQMYFPDIVAEYEVGGKTYRTPSFFDDEVAINDRERVDTIVAQFPVGKTITIHYNPDNPADSYIQALPSAGLPVSCIVRIILLVIVAVIGLAVLIAGLTQSW